MQMEGLCPDDVTFTCILKACGSIGLIEKGKHIHEEILSRNMLKNNTVIGNALVDMYAKCGLHLLAHQVLEQLPARDTISWNTIIAAYAEDGRCYDAFNCFLEMVKEGLTPNEVTFTCILKACGCTGAIEKGKQIHHEILKRGLLLQSTMVGTALVDMYAKCGALTKAQEVLRGISVRNVVTWNALISGYAHYDRAHDALNCFECMQREGISPNIITLICILKACGSIGAIDKGRQVHEELITEELLQTSIVLGNALVDMYAKCGMLAKARWVLEHLPVRDIISWSTLIAGYAERGQYDEALNCFHDMQREGCSPNEVTLLCVLNACGHSGRWDEAQMYYDDMRNKYGLVPKLEHHTSMVILLGCAGKFRKAMSVIQAIPSSARPATWLALLGACRKWENVKLGKVAFEKTIQMDDTLGAAYVLMTNIYAAAGMQEDAQEVEAMRVKRVITAPCFEWELDDVRDQEVEVHQGKLSIP
jgi:pentatricopeptide repeat protein